MNKHSKRSKMILSGEAFELLVGEKLEMLLPDSKVRYNYTFYKPSIGRGTECDVILVNPYGIYCVECKNYSTSISGNSLDPEWRFISRGSKSRVVNPFISNYKHIRAMQASFRRVGFGYIPIHNYVCVPDSCRIYSDRKEVVNYSSLMSRIRKDSLHRVVIKDVNKFVSLIDRIKYDERRNI